MKYRVRHLTRYRYADPVSNSQHDLHLLPRDWQRQRCLAAQLDIRPSPIVCRDRVDYFGNRATHVVLASPHDELVAVAESLVEVDMPAVLHPDQDSPWEEVRQVVQGRADDLHAQEMSYPSPFVSPWPDLIDYARPSFAPGRPMLAAAIDLMGRIHHDFTYDPRATTIATPLAELLKNRRGVCQDFAHLMIGCLRGFGLPARYVSGYLVTTPPPGQPRLQGADASHAWLSVRSPRFGFVDLDPTNDRVVGDTHITLAMGRDFGDVTPFRGVIHGGGRHTLDVGVDVILDGEA